MWQDYTAPLVFTENGRAYFRGTDAAGNASDIISYEVRNIQAATPDNALDDGRNDKLYDKKTKEWASEENIASFVVNDITAGDSEVLLDKAGSVDDGKGRHNFVGRAGGDEDAADYAKIELSKGAALSFSIDSTVAGTFYAGVTVRTKKTNQHSARRLSQGVRGLSFLSRTRRAVIPFYAEIYNETLKRSLGGKHATLRSDLCRTGTASNTGRRRRHSPTKSTARGGNPIPGENTIPCISPRRRDKKRPAPTFFPASRKHGKGRPVPAFVLDDLPRDPICSAGKRGKTGRTRKRVGSEARPNHRETDYSSSSESSWNLLMMSFMTFGGTVS